MEQVFFAKFFFWLSHLSSKHFCSSLVTFTDVYLQICLKSSISRRDMDNSPGKNMFHLQQILPLHTELIKRRCLFHSFCCHQSMGNNCFAILTHPELKISPTYVFNFNVIHIWGGMSVILWLSKKLNTQNVLTPNSSTIDSYLSTNMSTNMMCTCKCLNNPSE